MPPSTQTAPETEPEIQITPERARTLDIARRMVAGLTKDQAIEAADRQIAADAAVAAEEAKKKGKK